MIKNIIKVLLHINQINRNYINYLFHSRKHFTKIILISYSKFFNLINCN